MGLTELLQTALLALAFGCGIPALIYLAFKGNLREQNSRKEEKKPPPPQPQFPEFPDFPFTAMKKEEAESPQTVDGVIVTVPNLGKVFIPMKKPSQTEADLKALLELEDEEKTARLYHKIAVRGYLYIPKPVLREAIREAEAERRKPSIVEPVIGEAEKPAEPKPPPPRDDKLEVRRGG